MKQVFLTITVLIFFFSSVSAQINVTIFVQKPTPTSISSWQTLPNVVQVIITNSTPNPYSNCIISIKIKNQNGTVIAKTKDYDPSMPKFNIPGAPGTLMLNAPQLFKYDAIWVDPNIQSVVTTTNSLPEGDYQLCMSIIDPYGNQLVNGIEKCSDFNITLSDPPQLIMPLDKELLTTNYPHFFWTPGTISPYFIDVHYRLKIVKLFAQQSAKDAITTNSALFDKQIVGTSYQYLPSDFNIGNYTDSYGFAWQVQVYNNNQPVTGMGHDGKSEIWTFLPPAANPTTLKLVSPLDNSTISPASGVYKLVWDASKQKKSITSFTLKVVVVEQGQTPDIAMKVNQPVYYKENIPPGFYNYLIAEDQNVFYDQLKYAWQVFTCSTAYGGIIDSSVIWSFTVKSNFIETLTAVSPADNAVFPPDTGQHSGYSFIWNRDKVVKSISEYRLLIAPIDSGQTAAQAIKMNTPVVDKVVTEPIKSWKIMQEQGIFENKKYAWIVIASSKWYNNQIVAKTEPQMFS
jgi:hypothetical protein